MEIGLPVRISYRDFFATPSFTRISSMRHHFVKADCRRLSPTKAVKSSQYLLWK
jgi:hypothetical protein